MKPIRIAQIGISKYSHGTNIMNSIRKLTDIFEFVGYVPVEDEKEKFAETLKTMEPYKELTLEEVLSDPTITAVTVEPEEVHLCKYATLAAKAGKHIHMEKPGGTNLAEFEQLISTAKEQNIVLHIGYMYRYNPYVSQLMQDIRSGKLGEIICVEAQMNCIHPVHTRQFLSAFPGGMMFFLGCHLIDLILQIQGAPKRIIPLNKSTGIAGVDSQDFGMVVFEYENGVSFAKTSAMELGGFARRQLVVTGTKGTVELKPFEIYVEGGVISELKTGRTTYTGESWGDFGEYVVSDVYDRYDPMMTAFAAMVRGEKKNPYTLDYELSLYKTILTCCGGN